MRNFQDIFFIWVRTYDGILKSALVYLKQFIAYLKKTDKTILIPNGNPDLLLSAQFNYHIQDYCVKDFTIWFWNVQNTMNEVQIDL